MKDFAISGRVLLIVGFLALLLVAAIFSTKEHEDGPHSGVVTVKQHHELSPFITCEKDGTYACYSKFSPEQWHVVIKDGDKLNFFPVTEEQFNRIHVGEKLVFDGDSLKE